MTAEGVVRQFDADRGWGVLDSPETPGGCWVHFSAVVAPGYRSLTAGQRVFFRAEAVGGPGQDGYPYRATKVWSDGPVEPPDRQPDQEASGAYRSTLTIRYDEPAG
ncbi:cold shock domain-containing protein [Micromonospora sp. WMMD1102]|uniref:cold-shock protein n=1 Tax=Micromonospora sp. WMMD1102 TaxID=3016105 RepID=UPI0024153AD5|nr:cold shock domain-containing protein [Micromonospora sp. WMMD1102]MDG4788311.1 cold shock domain-containing protein [Micromonospora sp. WMMD1102]